MTQALAHILEDLHVPEALPLFQPHWEESGASLPDGCPGFLDPEEVTRRAEFARLPPELLPLLQETARRVQGCPALRSLAWHCVRLLFTHRDYPGSHISRWPALERDLGDLAGVFTLLIALEMVPLTIAAHRALGVPEAITRDTCGSFDELLISYRDAHDGKGWGAPVRVLYWLRHYTVGELFRLGRMEYMIQPFGKWVYAFRSRKTGEVLALAADGTRFNAEGTIDADREPAEGWTARLAMDGERVTGCPISPMGFAVRREVTLPRNEWACVLKPGDLVLDTHIPAGGGMTPERCADTMRRALEFFPRFFRDRPFAGFGCASWILNPQLERIYTPTSNMVLWQRELYLFPYPSGDGAGLFFLFGKDEADPATAPRDTSLRRALLDHVAAGGRLIAGGMFFLKEDFPRFGTQCYRLAWPPLVLR